MSCGLVLTIGPSGRGQDDSLIGGGLSTERRDDAGYGQETNAVERRRGIGAEMPGNGCGEVCRLGATQRLDGHASGHFVR